MESLKNKCVEDRKTGRNYTRNIKCRMEKSIANKKACVTLIITMPKKLSASHVIRFVYCQRIECKLLKLQGFL